MGLEKAHGGGGAKRGFEAFGLEISESCFLVAIALSILM